MERHEEYFNISDWSLLLIPTSDGLDNISLLALLSSLPMLLSSAVWTTVTAFIGASQSSTYINSSVCITVLLFSRQPHLFISSFTPVFPYIFIHTFYSIGVVTIPGILLMKVQTFLWFLNFLHSLISL